MHLKLIKETVTGINLWTENLTLFLVYDNVVLNRNNNRFKYTRKRRVVFIYVLLFIKNFFVMKKSIFMAIAIAIVLFVGNSAVFAQNNGNGNDNGRGEGNGGGNDGNGGVCPTCIPVTPPAGADCAVTTSTDQTDFEFGMTVDNYIETVASPLAWCFGTTSHSGSKGSIGSEQLVGNDYNLNFAYANCPYKVTVSGSNEAGQSVPRFARKETGTHGTGYDILPTVWEIQFVANSVSDYFGVSSVGATKVYAGQFPLSETYSEAPHNGQIFLKVKALVNTENEPAAAGGGTVVPVRQTAINSAYTAINSADAGKYKAMMKIVLTSQL